MFLVLEVGSKLVGSNPSGRGLKVVQKMDFVHDSLVLDR